MTMTRSPLATRRVALGLLTAGWALGGAIHLASVLATTWGDIGPELLLAGVILAFGAGMAVRLGWPARTQRWGAIGGLLMGAAIMAGTIVIDVFLVMPYHAGDSGETPFSLLIEAPFWIGIPSAVAAGMGWLGWQLARRVFGTADQMETKR